MKQMKQMKQIVLTITLLLFSVIVFSQTTPTGQVRIQNRDSAFRQNLPVGTQVYVVSDSTLWQVKVGIRDTARIWTSLDRLELINNSANYMVDKFEAVDITTKTYTLSYMPKIATIGVTVMMNGAALRPTLDYTTSGHTLTIINAQSEYDTYVVSYVYYRL
jgi:hypothetical protein